MFRVCSLAVSYKLPKTYIRPVLTSLLTAIFIILSIWLISIINFVMYVYNYDFCNMRFQIAK